MEATTAVSTKKASPAGSEFIFELVRRSNSQWIKKGQEFSQNPARMNAPKSYVLPMRSRKYMGKGLGYAEMQYVIGADTCMVNDYVDSKGVTRKGLKSQGYTPELLKEEYAKSVALNIRFENGILDLRKYGEDPVLAEFVRQHEDNESGPAKGGQDNRKTKQFNFRPLQKEVKAEKELESLEERVDALNFVKNLRTPVPGGFEYNQELLNACCVIFGLNVPGDKEGNGSKMLKLVGFATMNGESFMNELNEAVDDVRMKITAAIKLEVLQVTSKEAILIINKERISLRKLNATTESERITELAYYFIADPMGKQRFSSMNGEVDLAKAGSLKK